MRRGLLIAAPVVAAAAATLALSVHALSGRTHESARLVNVTVADAKLTLLNSFLRPPSRDEASASALEIAAFFPGFAPAGAGEDITSATDLDKRFRNTVFMTIRPRDQGLDPADRTAKIYERFLEPTSWSHPGGLIARAFDDSSPYRGEELYFTAPEGREFTARCRRPEPDRKTPNTCQTTIRMGDLDVDLRFSAALLSEWAGLRDNARSLIESARR